jgi:hypothetical protein
MNEPYTITALITLISTSTPFWLGALRDTLFEKGKELAIKEGIRFVHDKLHIDENEQLRHLESALKNATQKGRLKFQTLQERDQYSHVVTILSEPGAHSDAFRQEALRLFTLFDAPNITELNEIYNRSLRIRALTQPTPPVEIDAAVYLASFFDALLAELYNDPFFRKQMSDVIQLRCMLRIQSSMAAISTSIQQISEALIGEYTREHFQQDLEAYSAYMERTLRHLKLVGIVPKDRGNQNTDPELNAIFVPLRVASQKSEDYADKTPSSIIGWFERSPYLVLLGGPGSGKSTATRYFSWLHAAVNTVPPLISPLQVSLLPGKPLPLRIELRRLTEDRRQNLSLDFLDYTVRILLGRAGYKINRQMFEELLQRKLMFCLFDGLDEVATLEERRRLVGEIEDFTQRYPGNRILVTSRPVGYELARLSDQLFSHIRIEEFNDQQIRIFLEHWYAHVLKLSPLPPDDEQELDMLYKTLKENPRLHKLATNPLLLTVITALHRYERLPDRRVLVYDSCANLLLDTWAKLKGTDARWKDMRMGKEDQNACVGHLGYVLHERSQEDTKDTEDEEKASSYMDLANDVPTRFLMKEIEHFLRDRRLISEIAEQRAEAQRFIDLMKIDAGLIVERGKDENGEDLYGFVHRTFQEYFAAVDINERYLQEEDPTIVSGFLREHLHDPHWQEVTLLLIGKLKRKPATAQLRQVLDGKSRLSRYTNILHQDYFFVCSCLAEDVAVDNELAEFIAQYISKLAKSSPFPSQRVKALETLSSLTKSRQYADLGRKELMALFAQDTTSDISVRTHTAQILYKSYPRLGEQRQAIQRLSEILERSDLSIEQYIEVSDALFECSMDESQEQRQIIQRLSEILERSDLSTEQYIKVSNALFECSMDESQEQQQAIQNLVEIIQRPGLSLEQYAKAATTLCWYDDYDSQERQQATLKLMELLQHSDLSAEQSVNAAVTLLWTNDYASQERQQATLKLMELLQHSDLSAEQSVYVATTLLQETEYTSQERQQATLKLMELLQHSDLSAEQSVEQSVNAAVTLFWQSPDESQEQHKSIQKLLELLDHSDLSSRERIRIIMALNWQSSRKPQTEQGITRKFLQTLQRPDLPPKQIIALSEALFWFSSYKSQEYEQSIQKLIKILQLPNLSIEENIELAKAFHGHSNGSQEHIQSVQKLVEIFQQSNLSIKENIELAQAIYSYSSRESQEGQQIIQKLFDFLHYPNLSLIENIEITEAFNRCAALHLHLRQQASQSLMEKVLRANLPIDEYIKMVERIYSRSGLFSWERQQTYQILSQIILSTDLPIQQRLKSARILSVPLGAEENLWLTQKLLENMQLPNISFEQRLNELQMLKAFSISDSVNHFVSHKILELLQQTNITIEQMITTLQILHEISPSESQEKHWATEKLAEIMQKPDLSIEQSLKAAQALYECSTLKSEERQQAIRELEEIMQKPGLSVEQSLEAAQALYKCSALKSEERQQAASKLKALMQELTVEQRLKAIIVPLTVTDANYADRAQSVQTLLSLTNETDANLLLQRYWQPVSNDSKAKPEDIPFLIELVTQEKLPIELRDEVYKMLDRMIPEFGHVEIVM